MSREILAVTIHSALVAWDGRGVDRTGYTCSFVLNYHWVRLPFEIITASIST